MAPIVALALALPAPAARGGGRVLEGRHHWLFLARAVLDLPPAERDERARRAAAALAPAVRWLEQRGAVVAVELVPCKQTIYPHQLPPAIRFPSPYPELVRSMERQGLFVIDLREALRCGHEPTFRPDDTHWTPEGAYRAAQAVAHALWRKLGGALPGTRIEAHVERRRRVVLWGDLLGAGAPGEEGPSLQESDEVVGVANDTGEAIVAREPQDDVLLGTSQSADRRAGTILSAELSRVVEEIATEGRGPGAAFRLLAREITSGDRPAPRLVIWEIPENHALDERMGTVLGEALAPAPALAPPATAPRR